MRLNHFTDHTLPILANWSQFLGAATLASGTVAFLVRHLCAERHCVRPVFAAHPDTNIPLCRRHHPHGRHQKRP